MIDWDTALGTHPSSHNCEVCGCMAKRFSHTLQLWICGACDLPDNQEINCTENEVWRGLMQACAGKRRLDAAIGRPVGLWFLQRYAKLGLKAL